MLEILFGLQDSNLPAKGGIFLKAQDEDYLDMFLLHGEFSDEFLLREQRIPLGACLCGHAALSGELIISDDCFRDPRHEYRYDNMNPHGHYIVPIVSRGIILGVIFLYTDLCPKQNASRKAMLMQVGDMVALALLQEQAQGALESARDAALQAVQIKSDFLSKMSHEIRTPMNGVLGMLDILKDTDMSREQYDLVETAANSADALLNIINDILDFSKLETNKFELEQIDFDLQVLVEEVCALHACRAHTKGIELNCFLPANLPVCWQGDPTRIRQVLGNLIGNAIKFTEQGEVSVKVISPTITEDKASLCFEVRDTGVGISPTAQARLFQAFVQVDSSTARLFGGSGLGLSISKMLVELMGGAIGVESEEGKGSRFWFNLPLILGDKQQSLAPLCDLSGKRILVVDDNATNRTILEHYLKHWGITVDSYDDGVTALGALETAAKGAEPYELVLLDLHMPGMDGLALARAICESPSIAHIPRLLLSSGGLVSSNEWKSLGIMRSLQKPVRQTQLLDAILNALQYANPAAIGMDKRPPNYDEAFPDYSDKKVLIVEDTALAIMKLAQQSANNNKHKA